MPGVASSPQEPTGAAIGADGTVTLAPNPRDAGRDATGREALAETVRATILAGAAPKRSP